MLLLKPFFPGRSMLPISLRTFYFHFAYEFFHSHTRTLVGLLGPCFKTGQYKPFWQNRISALKLCRLFPACTFFSLLNFILPVVSVGYPQLLIAYPILSTVSLYRFLLNDFRSFHSLFKVLFIFPSQYLFAIGLPSIFSFGRFISPA